MQFGEELSRKFKEDNQALLRSKAVPARPKPKPVPQPKKVALAHDFLNSWGGGERVLAIFKDLYPEADIFSLTYDPEKTPEFKGVPIKTSIIQRLPGGVSHYKWYLALMPWAVERLDFSGYDLVLSDSSGFIKGIKTPEHCLHVCYIHTTTRYLTTDAAYFKETAPRITHPLVPFLAKFLKRRDLEGAKRPDIYIANSQETAARVEQYYDRVPECTIFPPVDTYRFAPRPEDEVGEYYLLAGRLVPYKRFDLAIEACNRLGKQLVVIGSGPEEGALKALAGPTIDFKGKVSDEELRAAYASCKAMFFPPLEDAGMTPLECMACGRPVLAFGKGGALESVVDGVTGLFFHEQTVGAVVDAIQRFEEKTFDSKKIIAHAEGFSAEKFKAKVKAVVDEALASRA